MGPRAPIELLPEHLIDQIKAGEVIERPANVLKELMENALDAGATRVDVEIKDNGLSLIRVSDDGCGIPAKELPLAFGRHATSKLRRFEDLYQLHTYGFRGEALAAVASIARVDCVSWTREEASGARLGIDGGVTEAVQTAAKSGRDHGTIMSVQDLFFNTPVRLRFMQSAGSEKNWLKKFFFAFVLGAPHVAFSLQWDQDERLIFPATRDTSERLLQLFSSKARERITLCSHAREWHGVRVEAWAIFAEGARPAGPIEHVLVNQRPVLDKAYARIAQQVCDGASLPSAPLLFLRIDIEADRLDVNVHPNKTLVKLHQQSEVHSLAGQVIREAIAQVRPATAGAASAAQLTFSAAASSTAGLAGGVHGNSQQDLEGQRDYSAHLERLQGQGPLSTTDALQLLHLGDELLFREGAAVFYVSARRLFLCWLQLHLGQQNCERIPLLVGHPIRGRPLAPAALAFLNSAGFEVDALGPELTLVREIPAALRGFSAGLLVEGALATFSEHGSPLALGEVTRQQWEKMWLELGAAAQAIALKLSPALLPRP